MNSSIGAADWYPAYLIHSTKELPPLDLEMEICHVDVGSLFAYD